MTDSQLAVRLEERINAIYATLETLPDLIRAVSTLMERTVAHAELHERQDERCASHSKRIGDSASLLSDCLTSTKLLATRVSLIEKIFWAVSLTTIGLLVKAAFEAFSLRPSMSSALGIGVAVLTSLSLKGVRV